MVEIFYIPFVVLIILRIFFDKEDKSKFKEKILPNKIRRPDGFLFWFHAASIGELNSILPIINFFLKEEKNCNFLITTTTLSSYRQLKKKFKENKKIFHQFLPYDSIFLTQSFLNNWKPNIASFVDSEIWPNFIFKIKKNGIPFILLNARITEKSFKRWKILNNFAKQLFETFSICFSSSNETSRYLEDLGAKNIKYFGNIKFCSSINNSNEFASEKFNFFDNKEIWCALSTHHNEEIFCADVHKILKKNNKNTITIILPRHIHRINKIYRNLKKMGLQVQIKNERDSIDKSAEVILVNYYGSVSKYLAKIKHIFIGKSLIEKLKKVGGQNPIEAAKMGCFIYHGPYVYNFKEIYDYLNKKKFSEMVNSPEILAEKLEKNFNSNYKKDPESINDLNNYGMKIFNQVIQEYNKFIK
tara:strand:- start:894 stop:2138 length:1245 start_codon:yes stop_codon:yes gene_type:complete